METWDTHWNAWCWNWSSNSLATWCEHLTHWKRPWFWGKIEGRRRRGQQGMRWLDGITASMDMNLGKPGRWWGTRKPGVLQSMVLQTVGHILMTEQKQWWWIRLNIFSCVLTICTPYLNYSVSPSKSLSSCFVSTIPIELLLFKSLGNFIKLSLNLIDNLFNLPSISAAMELSLLESLHHLAFNSLNPFSHTQW